jgi:hypothetical protein
MPLFAKWTKSLAIVTAVSLAASTAAQPAPREFKVEDARLLSPFGGRAAFSPDGKRVAFVGKTYADAYEIEIATGRVRNLTRDIPHQGIMRIQYLPSGDFLVTAPHKHTGPNTRAHLEMWVLDKDLRRGLQPLGEQVFEGIAVSRKRNLIAWTVIDPELKPGESWQMAFVRPTRRYMAEIAYDGGAPKAVNKREIMSVLPKECGFIEPQDFRDEDRELVYSCMGPVARGDFTISVMGNKLATGENVTYHRESGAYNEVEGIAPGGAWTTVECGKQAKPGIPPLDICRLELKPDGAIRRLVAGTTPGVSGDISNPIVSPDGRWLVFQRGDSATGEVGEGYGLYLLRLPD